MATLLDALKKAKLVDPKKAKQEEEKRVNELKREEESGEYLARMRSYSDQEDARTTERFLKRASRETTKASSKVGTRQYYDRFKK
jgi:hypothetical protein